MTVRCAMMLKREGNGQNQNKQPAEVGGPSPGMAIAQGEGLSKHMRKRVRVGRTRGKGALVTGRGICLQRRVGSLVFNAVLAPGPVNRPAFPFSCGAKGESKMDIENLKTASVLAKSQSNKGERYVNKYE